MANSDLHQRALDEMTSLRFVPPAQKATPSPAPSRQQASPAPDPTRSRRPGYVGKGVFRRAGTPDKKKLTIYLSLEAAAALRVAAARGADSRGASMGDIVEALLRENGYV